MGDRDCSPKNPELGFIGKVITHDRVRLRLGQFPLRIFDNIDISLMNLELIQTFNDYATYRVGLRLGQYSLRKPS